MNIYLGHHVPKFGGFRLFIIVGIAVCFLTLDGFSQISNITTGFTGKIVFNGFNPKVQKDYKRIYTATWSQETILLKAISPENMPVASPIVNPKLADKIVIRSGKLYTAMLNKSGTQLTKSLEFNKDIPFFYQGTLSPDGNKILFTRKNRKKEFAPVYDIFVFDINSGITYQLTSTKHNVCPAWSPEGKMIAFYRGERYEYDEDLDNPKNTQGYTLAVINSYGSNLKEIVTGSCIFDAYRDFPPQWSPDGSKILFDYRPTTQLNSKIIDIDRGMGDLYVVQPDGSGLKLLRKNKGHYSWSPDGSKIAVAVSYPSTKEIGPKVGINILDANGENEKVLLGSDHWANKPIWSPDGKWISYQEQGICLIYIETKSIFENITGDLVVQNDPVWLP